MRMFGPTALPKKSRALDAIIEAAPARSRVRLLAIGVFAVLLVLAGRAVQLGFRR